MNSIPFDRSHFKKQRDIHPQIESEIERLNSLPVSARVLEWGSGLSTVVLAETLKEESFILSIEHSKENLFSIPVRFSMRLKQVFLQNQQPMGKSDAYVTYPLEEVITSGEGFDLIIINGRNRADCLAMSAFLLREGGSVLLFNAERSRYQLHYSLFEDIAILPSPKNAQWVSWLREPVCKMTHGKKLASGLARHVQPQRNSLPCTWGVCAVALPRESYYWLRDWIEHHIKAGASKVTIYDNTGSVKSTRATSPYRGGRYQRKMISKRGEEYGRLTSHLSDEEICQELRDIAASYGELVEIIEWKPRHPKENVIVHGQVEAYCDFIRRHRDTLGWGLFVDMDEYIYCRPGLKVNKILEYVESEHPAASSLHLSDWQFECRWGTDGPKDISRHLVHHPTKHNCGKIMARLQDITHANVHWDWILKENCSRLRINASDMAFAHYMQRPENLPSGDVRIFPRLFLDIPEDPSAMPRISKNFYIDNCGVYGKPVDTTFLEMYEPNADSSCEESTW